MRNRAHIWGRDIVGRSRQPRARESEAVSPVEVVQRICGSLVIGRFQRQPTSMSVQITAVLLRGRLQAEARFCTSDEAEVEARRRRGR